MTLRLRRGEDGRLCFTGMPLRLHGQADAQGRVWNMLLPAGLKKFRGDFGTLEVTPEMLGQLETNFRAEQAAYAELNGGSSDGFGKPITITHVRGEKGEPTSQRAVGWVEDVKREADGFYGLVRWNAEGKDLVQGDKFRFFSVEMFKNWVDQNSNKEVGAYLDKVALLTDPLFFEMPRVAAAKQSNPAARPHDGETTMEWEKLKKLLGLDANASEADCLAAIEAGKVAKTSLDRARNEAITASASTDNLKAEKIVLEQRAVSAEKKVTELQAELEKDRTAKKNAEADQVVSELLKAGKIEATAQAEVKESVLQLGAEKVRKMFKVAPAIVATRETGVQGDPNRPAAEGKPEVDRITFRSELDKHIKAGRSTAEAYDLVRAEQPDLVARVSRLVPVHSRPPARAEE